MKLINKDPQSKKLITNSDGEGVLDREDIIVTSPWKDTVKQLGKNRFTFAGFLIIKNDTNNSARQIINAFTKTYQEYLNTTFQTNIFVLNEEEYEQCIKKLAEQTNINTDTFSEFDIVSEFRLSVTSDGLSKSENEVNKLLQGGE
ncbi:MAG: hypothetical protein HLX45_12460 [Bacillus sp. (in: Bacteria)]|nr:hypothetical protein [Bacillus sp. (in: firmicutes)]